MTKKTHLKTTLLASGLALLSGASALACPKGDDALTGIELIYTDGTRSIITRAPDGTVTEVEELEDGVFNTYIAQKGILETAYRDSETNTEDNFTYSFDVPTPETIKPWTGNQGEQVTTGQDQTEIARIPFSWMSRGLETRKVAGCTYQAIPFQVTYFNPEGATAVEFLWLPDLGISISLGYYETGYPSPFVPEVFRKNPE